jgi:hypothetical protein
MLTSIAPGLGGGSGFRVSGSRSEAPAEPVRVPELSVPAAGARPQPGRAWRSSRTGSLPAGGCMWGFRSAHGAAQRIGVSLQPGAQCSAAHENAHKTPTTFLSR